MFITAKARNFLSTAAELAIDAACAALPPGFSYAAPTGSLGFGENSVSDGVVVELRRIEEVTEPERALTTDRLLHCR
jgi:hypothetical protein